MPFEFKSLGIQGVILVTPSVFSDERGAFVETFKATDFAAAGIDATWKQLNCSISQKHVLRGMHFQLQPRAQGKLISVVHGHIFDVVIDIRKSSETFGKWTSIELDSESRQMLWVPPGFAHGFCTLSDTVEVMYACTDEYAPESERGILWNDPAIGITWPTDTPILSPKDETYPLLANAEINFT
jgi:dTDP-4-dehydrorhamnose 3,5-epimerase